MEAIDRYKPSPDEGKLTGKVLIITGSTQGLGEAFALRSAYLGAAGIVIVGRNRANGEQVARAVEQIGPHSLFVEADLSSEQDCHNVIAATDERFGRIDGLVNSAGITSRGTLDDTSVTLWDHHFALNVRAPFLLIQGATRIMRREAIHGSIVNIITMASHVGEPVLTPYTASKAALATMTKNVAYQLQPYRIRVNGLNIGWTDTPAEHAVQMASGQPADWLEQDGPMQPFGRLQRPEDIAPMVTFLLSDLASMVTGSVMDWDQTINGAYGAHIAFENIVK